LRHVFELSISKERTYFVGEQLTLADIYIYGDILEFTFEVTFDDGFRKAIPNLTTWFVRDKSRFKRLRIDMELVQMAQESNEAFH